MQLGTPRGGDRAGLGCEPESGAEEEDKPDRWAPPVSMRERMREGACGRFLARASSWPRRERERWAVRGAGPRRRKREEGGSG
jgi:hypothetical protein